MVFLRKLLIVAILAFWGIVELITWMVCSKREHEDEPYDSENYLDMHKDG